MKCAIGAGDTPMGIGGGICPRLLAYGCPDWYTGMRWYCFWSTGGEVAVLTLRSRDPAIAFPLPLACPLDCPLAWPLTIGAPPSLSCSRVSEEGLCWRSCFLRARFTRPSTTWLWYVARSSAFLVISPSPFHCSALITPSSGWSSISRISRFSSAVTPRLLHALFSSCWLRMPSESLSNLLNTAIHFSPPLPVSGVTRLSPVEMIERITCAPAKMIPTTYILPMLVVLLLCGVERLATK
mmetsp:Transcript_54440/g.128451  ORF Transcript_54440/g.128451 Transcript_54440/m.128451 type:complete len:239 (+) Transcript_54440:538-1254(+)